MQLYSTGKKQMNDNLSTVQKQLPVHVHVHVFVKVHAHVHVHVQCRLLTNVMVTNLRQLFILDGDTYM